MKWHKLMFVLPNAFTVSSIFCGFYAIIQCATGTPTAQQLYGAALAIFFAIFFDGFDGRVARLTRTQSDFGVELDSLADVISFGVAPALLAYKWALAPLGFGGVVICFAFATCGALRLARFNVMTQRKVPGSSKFFTGLPIPLAAGVLISLVIAYHHAGMTVTHEAQAPIAALVTVLAALMVSGVRYRTFKDVRLSKKSATIFLAVVLAGVAVATQMRPSFVLVAYFSAYLLLGLAEEVVFFRRRRAEAKAAKTPPPNGPEGGAEGGGEEEDEEEGEEYI
ncbi:MAG TPA: CDP-diacylglycerol--serine O-phosphatidyltransferase [Myxococcales bacterium]|jgi:CDP-diacylglycerol--serine O-phosphatidyltransferase